jgi:hypothetical protein
MTSTSIRSSILGPIGLIRLHDYDSNHENAELANRPGQVGAEYPPNLVAFVPRLFFFDLDPIPFQQKWRVEVGPRAARNSRDFAEE